MKRTYRKWLTGIALLLLAASFMGYYFMTKTFDNTKTVPSDYTLSSDELFSYFEKNEAIANKKFSEKIITVQGLVATVEKVDSSVNLTIVQKKSNNYLIFSFQDDQVNELLTLKEGTAVEIKASCSGAISSEILGNRVISFKRSVLIKK